MFKKEHIAFVVTAIVALLTFASAAYAAHIAINTNDGAGNGDWDTVSVVIDDGIDTAANYDIVEARVGNEAADGAFYFQVALAGTGRLPHDYSALEARLDCDQDGDFTDAGDVVVYYALDAFLPGGEEVIECQGSDYIDCDYAPEPNRSDTNPATFGKEMAGPPYRYEWRADMESGATDWSACLEAFDVQFASVDNAGGVQDVTAWRRYSDSNAVDLANLVAQTPILPIAATVLGIAILGGFLMIRSRNRNE